MTLRGLLFLAFAAAVHAQGGPPFITDDPGTPGDHHWEINVAWTHERRGSETSSELPLIDMNYGVGPALQLKFEVPVLLHDGADGTHERGFGDSLLGVKWRFLDQKTGPEGAADTAPVSASIYPQFGFATPGSSARHEGLVDGGTTFIAPVEITRDLGSGWAVNVDFGAELHSRAKNRWFGGCVIGRDLGEKAAIGAELHVDMDPRFGVNVVVADVGGHVQVSEHQTLLLSIGRELRNAEERKASLVLYLGWQFTF